MGTWQGQVRVARSNRDLTYTQVEQDKTDFELNVRKLVKQFNLQSQRVHIAARTDETAQRRADVARRLYILGKSTVLDLNASISEKDAARRNYITALYNYWSLYYTLRSITLYDFEVDAPLTETEKNRGSDGQDDKKIKGHIINLTINCKTIKILWILNSKRSLGTSATAIT